MGEAIQRLASVTVHDLWIRGTSVAIVAYDAAMAFTWISIDHRIMGGVPCIRGTRIPVAMLVRLSHARQVDRQA